MPHSACLDLIKQVHVTPSLTRAFWSAERAWPGDTVRLHLETRYVPDGATVVYEVRPADPEIDLVVATVGAGDAIAGSQCVVEHAIDWDDAALDALFEVKHVYKFCFVATIEKYGLSLRSGPLYVPFEPFEV
jgi:hypothetical protein